MLFFDHGVVVAILIGLPLIVALYIRSVFPSKRVCEMVDAIPGPPKQGPFGVLGHVRLLPHPSKVRAFVQEQIRKYGHLRSFWIVNQYFVGVSAPEGVRQVVRSSEPKAVSYGILAPWLGDGLLLSYGDLWKRRRRLITPAFHHGILKTFMHVYERCGMTLIKKWEKLARESGTIDVTHEASLVTLDVIGECAFGEPIHAINDDSSEFVEAAIRASIDGFYMMRQSFLPDWLNALTPRGRNFHRSVKILHEHADDIIARRKAEHEARRDTDKSHPSSDSTPDSIRRKNFISILLSARDKEVNSEPLTDKDIRDEVSTFMFEGFDTTACSLMYTLRLLARHPEYQERIYDEVLRVLGPSANAPTYDQLNQLTLLHNCVKESLRMFPSVPAIARHLTKDMEIMGKTVPAGTTVIAAIQAMQMHEDWFERPDEFWPERFDEENAKHHIFAYLPFSAHKRSCIGQNLASHEERTLLAMLVRRFRFTDPNPDEPIPQEPMIVLRPNRPMPLNIELRE